MLGIAVFRIPDIQGALFLLPLRCDFPRKRANIEASSMNPEL